MVNGSPDGLKGVRALFHSSLIINYSFFPLSPEKEGRDPDKEGGFGKIQGAFSPG